MLLIILKLKAHKQFVSSSSSSSYLCYQIKSTVLEQVDIPHFEASLFQDISIFKLWVFFCQFLQLRFCAPNLCCESREIILLISNNINSFYLHLSTSLFAYTIGYTDDTFPDRGKNVSLAQEQKDPERQ